MHEKKLKCAGMDDSKRHDGKWQRGLPRVLLIQVTEFAVPKDIQSLMLCCSSFQNHIESTSSVFERCWQLLNKHDADTVASSLKDARTKLRARQKLLENWKTKNCHVRISEKSLPCNQDEWFHHYQMSQNVVLLGYRRGSYWCLFADEKTPQWYPLTNYRDLSSSEVATRFGHIAVGCFSSMQSKAFVHVWLDSSPLSIVQETFKMELKLPEIKQPSHMPVIHLMEFFKEEETLYLAVLFAITDQEADDQVELYCILIDICQKKIQRTIHFDGRPPRFYATSMHLHFPYLYVADSRYHRGANLLQCNLEDTTPQTILRVSGTIPPSTKCHLFGSCNTFFYVPIPTRTFGVMSDSSPVCTSLLHLRPGRNETKYSPFGEYQPKADDVFLGMTNEPFMVLKTKSRTQSRGGQTQVGIFSIGSRRLVYLDDCTPFCSTHPDEALYLVNDRFVVCLDRRSDGYLALISDYLKMG
jgi:hypothetical protein